MHQYTAQYRDRGFCVVPNLLSSQLCLEVLAQIDAVFASQLNVLGMEPVAFEDEESLYANMLRLFRSDVNAYLAAARHLNKLLSIQDLLFHQRIRGVLNELGLALPSVPTSPVVSIMSEQLKIQGGYFGLSPHQDWPSIQGSLDAVIVWAPLMDVPADRFPLQVIPGSHLKGMWEGINTASAREIKPELYNEADFVPVEMKRGDVAFMTTFTVHRSGVHFAGKACSGLRIGCNTRIENTAEATFIERGFPCAYKRVVERELITKDFPAEADVVRLFKRAG